MCGIVGVHNVPGAAMVAERALDALTNRGQDATGIAVHDPEERNLIFVGGEGTPDKVYDLQQIANFTGRLAVGQNRYTTNGEYGRVQPTDENDSTLTITHNGDLTHTQELDAELAFWDIDTTGANDTKRVSLLFAHYMANGASPEQAAKSIYRLIHNAGSFCIIAADAVTDTMVVMRDPRGIRPLVVAQKDEGYVVASETSALDAAGIHCTLENEDRVWRNVRAGELLVFDQAGMRSEQLEEGKEAMCSMEFVYVANNSSILYHQVVGDIRRDLGRQLAREHPPAPKSIVVGVPNSGLPYAEGFAQQAQADGIDVELVNDALYIAEEAKGVRSFMEPTQAARRKAIRSKLRVLVEKIRGKIVYFTEDSILRGNAMGALNEMLDNAGVLEKHARVGSPPARWPNGLGLATSTQEELVAHGRTIEQVREKIGVDSLGHVSVKGFVEAIKVPAGYSLTMPDFTGENPIVNLHEQRRPEPAFATS